MSIYKQRMAFGSKSTAYEQLPHYDDLKFRALKRTNPKEMSSFTTFLALPDEQKKRILSSQFTPEKVTDMVEVMKVLPNYTMGISIETEGFEDIVKGDLVNLRVTVKRDCLKRELGIIHSNFFEGEFQEEVYVILVGNNNYVMNHQKLLIRGEESFALFPYPVNQAGKCEVTVMMLSFNYIGVNLTDKFKFEVLPSSQKRTDQLKRIEEREPEKIEPSWMQKQLMATLYEQDEEREEQESESEESKD